MLGKDATITKNLKGDNYLVSSKKVQNRMLNTFLRKHVWYLLFFFGFLLSFCFLRYIYYTSNFSTILTSSNLGARILQLLVAPINPLEDISHGNYSIVYFIALFLIDFLIDFLLAVLFSNKTKNTIGFGKALIFGLVSTYVVALYQFLSNTSYIQGGSSIITLTLVLYLVYMSVYAPMTKIFFSINKRRGYILAIVTFVGISFLSIPFGTVLFIVPVKLVHIFGLCCSLVLFLLFIIKSLKWHNLSNHKSIR